MPGYLVRIRLAVIDSIATTLATAAAVVVAAPATLALTSMPLSRFGSFITWKVTANRSA